MARIALVTGASRGIGAATARALAQRGCDVAINYLRNREAADEVARSVRDTGRRAIVVQADVGSYEAVRAMVAQTVAELGALHIVVNNGGHSHQSRVQDLRVEDWDRMLGVYLSGAFYCVKEAVPHMKAAGWGRIVSVSSLRALSGSDHGPHYAAAKAGLLGFTKSLALELGPAGITANVVAPGYTRTDLIRKALETKGDAIRASIPLRREAAPEEVAALIGFLASDDGSYVTGETVSVNGGLHMR
jgi:3-oxoacyl-[acyl-carrier protein] reductase